MTKFELGTATTVVVAIVAAVFFLAKLDSRIDTNSSKIATVTELVGKIQNTRLVQIDERINRSINTIDTIEDSLNTVKFSDLKALDERILGNTAGIGHMTEAVGQISGAQSQSAKVEVVREIRESVQELAVQYSELDDLVRKHPDVRVRRTYFPQLFETGFSGTRRLGEDFDACFFSELGGKFGGAAELVTIYTERNHWYVKAKIGGGNPDIQANITCIRVEVGALKL